MTNSNQPTPNRTRPKTNPIQPVANRIRPISTCGGCKQPIRKGPEKVNIDSNSKTSFRKQLQFDNVKNPTVQKCDDCNQSYCDKCVSSYLNISPDSSSVYHCRNLKSCRLHQPNTHRRSKRERSNEVQNQPAPKRQEKELKVKKSRGRKKGEPKDPVIMPCVNDWCTFTVVCNSKLNFKTTKIALC